jgi:hypothetical protein
MIIGFNPNYPSLHMREALEAIVSGKSDSLGWSAEDIASVVAQANTLIYQRGKSLTQHELSGLNALLDLIKKAA